MDRRDVLLACARASILVLTRPAWAQAQPRVVFLNPGEPFDRGAGPYWSLVAQSMGAAAKSLGVRLEVLYGERDRLLMMRQAEEVARRSDPPDYVIMVNEKSAAPQMFRMFANSAAKILLLHNDLTDEQRREIGNEREQIANWIGTVTSDPRHAAFLLMEYLYDRIGSPEPRIIGITGDPNTPVSMERARGVEDYVSRAGRGKINQLVFGDWSYADGEQKAAVLLTRYPDTNIIWAANDSMALGALRAVKASGRSVLVGGMGGWPDALSSVAEGGLAATAAGNFVVGPFAIVLLYDYHQGIDFAAHGGVAQQLQYFIVSPDNVARYESVLMKRIGSLDFSQYSKALHPGPGAYDFSIKGLVDQRNTL
jgi:ABC-type sugar transport system substrate-binding protein